MGLRSLLFTSILGPFLRPRAKVSEHFGDRVACATLFPFANPFRFQKLRQEFS